MIARSYCDETLPNSRRQTVELSRTAYPPEENIKMTENITFISVDVETTSNDNSGEIIELSATLNDNEFDQYALPKSDISDRSSQITSLRKIGNVLLYKGSPVDTVGMRECTLKFLDWLNKIDGKKILYGQNSKGCDSRMICKAFRDVNLEKEFGQSVLGYSDTLPLFRRLYPNQESHTQEQLCKNLIGYRYTAHNSLEDARALQNLVSRLEITEKDLLKDSFTIEFVFKRQNFIEKKVKISHHLKLWSM